MARAERKAMPTASQRQAARARALGHVGRWGPNRELGLTPWSSGYGRASRLIEAMAAAGIVGSYKGSQAREAQITVEEWEQMREPRWP